MLSQASDTVKKTCGKKTDEKQNEEKSVCTVKGTKSCANELRKMLENIFFLRENK